MSFLKSILLISDGIKTNDFDGNFLLNLLYTYSKSRLYLLWCPNFDDCLPKEFDIFIKEARLKIFYGTSLNGALIKKIINENKV